MADRSDIREDAERALAGKVDWNVAKQPLLVSELVPWGYAPGDYMFKCFACEGYFTGGDKRCYRCERCAMIARYTEAEKRLADLAYLQA